MRSSRNGFSAFEAAGAFAKTKAELIQALWMPVQIEPIVFSGERITVGVGIVCEEAPGSLVIPTLHQELLEPVFGTYGDDLISLAEIALSDLQRFLVSGGFLKDWIPRMQGVHTGRIVSTKNQSMKAIIRSALVNSSLFSAKAKNPPRNTAREVRQRDLPQPDFGPFAPSNHFSTAVHRTV